MFPRNCVIFVALGMGAVLALQFFPKSDISTESGETEFAVPDVKQGSGATLATTSSSIESHVVDSISEPADGTELQKLWSPASMRVLAHVGDSVAIDVTELASQFGVASTQLSVAERRRLVAEMARLLLKNIEVAIDFVDRMSDRSDRKVFAASAAGVLFEQDPHAAILWTQEIQDESVASHVYGLIGRKWANSDLESALAWSSELRAESSFHEDALEGIVFSWALRDTNGAFAWIMEHEQEAVQDRMLAKIAKVIAGTNPKDAAEWAVQLEPSKQASQALQYAVHRWASMDTQTALRWAESQPGAETRLAAMVSVASAWSAAEPGAAVDWITSWNNGNVSVSTSQKRAVRTAAKHWKNRNSRREAVSSFIALIDDSDLKQIAADTLAQND